MDSGLMSSGLIRNKASQNIFSPIEYLNSEKFDLLALQPALWLDANDSSTITTVSESVSEWRDKSGNNLHASQTTASNRPLLVTNGLNNTNVIRFDGNNDILQSTNSINLTSGFSFFFVGKNRIAKNFNGIFRIHNSIVEANSDLEIGYEIGSNSGNLFSVANRGSSFRGNTINNTLPPINTFGLTQITHINSSTAEYRVNSNLIPVTGSYGSGNLLPLVANNYYIGVSYGDSSRFDGDISKIIIFPRVLPQVERQKVEGYLAWSTALQDNLPTNHPYKNLQIILS